MLEAQGSSRPSRIGARPDVAIVVPVHNALEYVQHTLNGVVVTYPDVPLILVDDCSDDETHEWLSRFLTEQWPGPPESARVLLRNERQQMFTRTVNRGIRWAYNLRHREEPIPVDFVAVVNSDCQLRDNWLKALRLGMEDPQVGVVGFSDIADGQEPAYRELREPDYVCGHCLLLRVRMLEEIGVFCETDVAGSADSPDLERLLGQAHVGSDRALSWRANRVGWKTLHCHCLLCDHAGGKSWHHDLNWLASFDLQPLWPPCDRLDNPGWKESERGRGP